MLSSESKKTADTTLIIQKKNQDKSCQSYSFYDEQKNYVISIKDFSLSNNGLLSLLVPFDDGRDYKADLKIDDIEAMTTIKNGNRIVALAHDSFYR